MLITRGNGVSLRLEPVFEPGAGERIFGLDQGKFVVPEDFDSPMTFEDLLLDRPSETKTRREVVLALCRLADSLPVLDLRSPEEILSGDDS